MSEADLLKKKAHRERLARKEAERLLEEKSRELYFANQELAKLNESLEEKVIERTREFEAERDKALEASRVKSQFLANMSHELRTPMNGILNFIDLLGEKQTDPTSIEYVKTARKSGELLLAIRNDILDISKIEAGKLQIDKVDFSLHDLLSTVLQTFSTQAAQKSIGLRLEIEGIVPQVLFSDPHRLNQILTNLIGNALKFTESGEIVVKVRTDLNEKRLFFSVADSGIGISEDRIEAIFEAFEQADLSDTRKYGGTGLGLAIVKRILDSLGGDISVSSALGKGTTFVISIPLEPGKQVIEFSSIPEKPQAIPEKVSVVSLVPKPPALKPEPACRVDSHKTVLLVDDNEVNKMVGRALLVSLGYDCLVASNGQEAVDVTKKEKIDTILMDCQMPVMDGLEATRQIREKNSDLPIIAVTANAQAETKAQCLSAGMNEFLTKPFSKEQLSAILEKYI